MNSNKLISDEQITHPLVSLERIEARHAAVEELLSEPAAALHWLEMMKGLPDLERALARLQYRKCGPQELVALLSSLSQLCERARLGLPLAESLQSQLLRSLMIGFPDLADQLRFWLDAVKPEVAGSTNPDKRNLLRGYDHPEEYPEICSIRGEIAQVLNAEFRAVQ